jgi:glycosyltransferase involved in cell wall biosynthesis
VSFRDLDGQRPDARSVTETVGSTPSPFDELVVCSLKAWDEVWNRNNFFTDALLRRNPELRVLFVEPPTDMLYDVSRRRLPTLPRARRISADRRLMALRPLKVLPRRVGPLADALLRAQVLLAARLLRFTKPVLWINDVTYAPLLTETSWPSVYDVSDDWLLAPFDAREIDRLRQLDELALERADEVVVCSPALAETRGARRPVSLVRNAVDVEHFRRPRERPVDLPPSPVAVYAGTAHDARIDVELVVDLARDLPWLHIVFVGPNALTTKSQQILDALPNLTLLGPRPYHDLPAYLQHANVVIVPHRVTPFMESLDPIKAYECLAIQTPTVATPVPGFRESPDFSIADRDEFGQRVAGVLDGPTMLDREAEPPTWEARADEFERALASAVAGRRSRSHSAWVTEQVSRQ